MRDLQLLEGIESIYKKIQFEIDLAEAHSRIIIGAIVIALVIPASLFLPTAHLELWRKIFAPSWLLIIGGIYLIGGLVYRKQILKGIEHEKLQGTTGREDAHPAHRSWKAYSPEHDSGRGVKVGKED